MRSSVRGKILGFCLLCSLSEAPAVALILVPHSISTSILNMSNFLQASSSFLRRAIPFITLAAFLTAKPTRLAVEGFFISLLNLPSCSPLRFLALLATVSKNSGSRSSSSKIVFKILT
uniref:Secreted protein n=1 Tax=Cacopsylla melanoneura TaxID=428564 RepID=A0A8D9BPU6_9HEMI